MKKVLGIVRKIDHLGRIVIPKEVRRTQGWEEGTPMEMFMDKEGLIIRPYSHSENEKLITELETVKEATDNLAVIMSVDKVIQHLKK